MIDNLPLRTHVYRGLTIEGYSRAAVQSYWRIPELKLGFDMGGSPWSFMGTNTFFISHGHLDHMAALPVFVARRRMMKMEPPTIYVPARIHDQVWKMLNAWRQLDRGRMICNLVPVADGDEFELSRERVVTVFDTVHTVPSVGYLVWDRRRKLKEDLVGAGEDEIRKRRLGGEDVTREVRMGDFFKGKLPGKIATVFALLVLSRVGTYIPISGVDRTAFAESLAGSGGMMGYVDTLTGGSISKLGIFSLGIVPYINSSIIFQLLGSVFPELKKL